MKMYRCRNDCTVTDNDALRCVRCGEIMLTDGEATEENIERVKREVQERQMAYRKEYHEGRNFAGN